MTKKILLVILICIVCVFVGCGKAKVSGLVQVRGTITHNGNPLEGATVSFMPKQYQTGDRFGTGMTDASGNFTLRTIGEPGVLPNEYNVIVIKNIAEENVQNNNQPQNKNGKRPIKKITSLIPARYNNPKTSGLSFVVGDSGLKDVKIELVD